ncbi:MAG TPA: tetratricopeptide repeat protein, partial [bacterium]
MKKGESIASGKAKLIRGGTMTSWRVAGIVLLALITGCAVSPLRQAEKHIANQEYREALQVYMRSLNPTIRNGKRYISYEPETVTGIGVVLWHMKRYDTAVRILQSVVKRSPEYGKALFYLGACYESQKQLDKAQNAYALYTSVNPKDPYRDPIRWRLDWITRVKGSIDVRRATENEASIQLSSFSKESVAILYFQNLSQNTRWNPLQKGLAEMATIDLSQVDALKVIPRSRLEGVMRQLKLSVTGMMDDSRSLQVAKLLGARTLIKGSFRVYPDNKLEIRAGTLYVPESKMPDYVAFTGTVDRLPIIEKQLVRKILADLGVTPTPDQDRALAEVHT